MRGYSSCKCIDCVDYRLICDVNLVLSESRYTNLFAGDYMRDCTCDNIYESSFFGKCLTCIFLVQLNVFFCSMVIVPEIHAMIESTVLIMTMLIKLKRKMVSKKATLAIKIKG